MQKKFYLAVNGQCARGDRPGVGLHSTNLARLWPEVCRPNNLLGFGILPQAAKDGDAVKGREKMRNVRLSLFSGQVSSNPLRLCLEERATGLGCRLYNPAPTSSSPAPSSNEDEGSGPELEVRGALVSRVKSEAYWKLGSM